MGEAIGQLTVVGQDQQPLGGLVEPADGKHPWLGRNQTGTMGRPWGSAAELMTPGGL